MLFGLINAPAIFQGDINKILTKKLDVFVIVYLDDIFSYIKDKAKVHVKAVRWFLEQLQKFLLYANRKKTLFPPETSLISRLYCIPPGYLNAEWKDQGCTWLASTSVSTKHMGFFRICQFLPQGGTWLAWTPVSTKHLSFFKICQFL